MITIQRRSAACSSSVHTVCCEEYCSVRIPPLLLLSPLRLPPTPIYAYVHVYMFTYTVPHTPLTSAFGTECAQRAGGVFQQSTYLYRTLSVVSPGQETQTRNKKRHSSLSQCMNAPRHSGTDEFQFPPHHRLMRSPPHSSYSAFVTPTVLNPSVFAKSAMPFHASSVGSAARTISSGISGGRIGRSVACRRSLSPGSWDGVPVKKTFYRLLPQHSPRVDEEVGGT